GRGADAGAISGHPGARRGQDRGHRPAAERRGEPAGGGGLVPSAQRQPTGVSLGLPRTLPRRRRRREGVPPGHHLARDPRAVGGRRRSPGRGGVPERAGRGAGGGRRRAALVRSGAPAAPDDPPLTASARPPPSTSVRALPLGNVWPMGHGIGASEMPVMRTSPR